MMGGRWCAPPCSTFQQTRNSILQHILHLTAGELLIMGSTWELDLGVEKLSVFILNNNYILFCLTLSCSFSIQRKLLVQTKGPHTVRCTVSRADSARHVCNCFRFYSQAHCRVLIFYISHTNFPWALFTFSVMVASTGEEEELLYHVAMSKKGREGGLCSH